MSRRHLLAAGALAPLGTAAVGALRPRPVAPGLEIHPRSDWARDLTATGPLEPEPDVRYLLVHHTAGNTSHAPSDVPGILRGYFRTHTTTKGWPDIAYNLLIDRHGGVWEGRSGSLDGPVRGDATGGNQGFDQLVCLIGDFTSTAPTAAAQDSLVAVLAWLSDRHGIATRPGATATFTSRGSNRWPAGRSVTTPTIAGHRDMSQTACPGDAFYPIVRDQLLARVDAARAGGPPATTTTRPSTTTSTPPSTTTSESTVTSTSAVSSTTSPPTPVRAATSDDDVGDDRVVVAGLAVTAAAAITGGVLRRRMAAGRRSDVPHGA